MQFSTNNNNKTNLLFCCNNIIMKKHFCFSEFSSNFHIDHTKPSNHWSKTLFFPPFQFVSLPSLFTIHYYIHFSLWFLSKYTSYISNTFRKPFTIHLLNFIPLRFVRVSYHFISSVFSFLNGFREIVYILSLPCYWLWPWIIEPSFPDPLFLTSTTIRHFL